jgi:hypothetical protein
VSDGVVGMQSYVVQDVQRAREHTWLLVDSAAEPGLHLEVPESVARRHAIRTCAPGALPRDEPSRGHDRHGCRGRDSTVLERVSEAGGCREEGTGRMGDVGRGR